MKGEEVWGREWEWTLAISLGEWAWEGKHWAVRGEELLHGWWSGRQRWNSGAVCLHVDRGGCGAQTSCGHSSNHSLNKYLLSTCYVLCQAL